MGNAEMNKDAYRVSGEEAASLPDVKTMPEDNSTVQGFSGNEGAEAPFAPARDQNDSVGQEAAGSGAAPEDPAAADKQDASGDPATAESGAVSEVSAAAVDHAAFEGGDTAVDSAAFDTGGAAEDPETPEIREPELSDDTLVSAMEAILFAMGDSVPVSTLAQALRISEERADSIAAMLARRCEEPASGLVLNRYEDAIQLSTKPELLEYLIRIASQPKKPRLTPTLMETLSIIAFKQPVTRMEVENIRGVNSDFAINRLVSFDLVQEVGRKEVPGRPLLFGTTEQFLRSFGISSVDDLPEPEADRMEEFREEAEEEVSTGLNV